MKLSLISLLIAIALIANVHAVGFRVEFTNKFASDKVSTNVMSSIQIYMNNGASPQDTPRLGFSMPLMVYGDADISWVNVGGPTNTDHPEYFWSWGQDTQGSLIAYGNFGPGSAWFVLVNLVNLFSGWDSNLPDTINFTGVGMPGPEDTAILWPTGLGDLLAYELFFNTGPNEGNICIDSISVPDDVFDWLWLPPSGPFGGPYCITIEDGPMPPQFINCPTEPIEMQWHEQISLVLEVDDPEGDPITAAEANIGAVEITGPDQVTWTYNPTCDDVGMHIIEICVEDGIYSCPGLVGSNTCQFEVNVLNTPPQFTNCPELEIPVPMFGTQTIDLDAIDPNTGDILTYSVIAPCASVDANGRVTLDGGCIGVVGQYEVYVTVTDCAGASDVCALIFDIVCCGWDQIAISYEENVYQGHYQAIAITKESGSNAMYGFDFLIAYDASALSLMGVTPGVLFDPDGYFKWEYFTYRFGPFGNCGNACPSGLVRVVGIAETNDGPNHPSEYFIPDGTDLFYLNFLVTNNRTFECQFVPIRFYWMDCGDNTIAYHPATDPDPLAILTGVSKWVYEFQSTGTYYEITNDETGYPTYTGFQGFDACPPLPLKPPPTQIIDFFNGGIKIICGFDIDDKGDINLNGIAYEIADAVVLVNYFIYGLNAFTINIEGQTAASDVNVDGRPLTVADLVYLVRVITGDALPHHKLSPYSEIAEFYVTDGIIKTNQEIGAVYFEFDGNQDISLAASAQKMELSSHFDGTKTRAIIYSLKMNQTCSGNLLIANAIPATIEAVDYFGSAYRTEFGQVPDNFSLTVYPNPFNAVATIQFNLPSNTPWNYRIYNIAGQKVFESQGISAGGKNEILWNADNMATGIYFGTLSFEGHQIVEKMILLK